MALLYRKMLAVGVPELAVKEKMRKDGLPKHMIDSVMTRNSQPYIRHDGVMVRRVKRSVKRARRGRLPTLLPRGHSNLKPKEIAKPYKKLLKRGILPIGAVKQRMILDGVTQNVIDIIEAEATKASGLFHVRSFYGNLLRTGMSVEDVRMKMLVAGVASEIRDAIAPAPVVRTNKCHCTTELYRSATNHGRTNPCPHAERQEPLREIAACRGYRRTAPTMDETMVETAFVGDEMDDEELIQKLQAIEE